MYVTTNRYACSTMTGFSEISGIFNEINANTGDLLGKRETDVGKSMHDSLLIQ